MSANPILKLQRLLYLNQNDCIFLAGNPERYFLKNYDQNLLELEIFGNTVGDANELVKILSAASADELLPYRVTLFYVLAFVLSKTKAEAQEQRKIFSRAVLSICKNDEEFFKFISVYSILNNPYTMNKISTAMAKVVKLYLEKKSVTEFAYSVGQTKGYHGWTFKDIIILSHYKSASVEKTTIVAYVLGKLHLENFPTDFNSRVSIILSHWETLKKTKNIREAAELIRELHANLIYVNPKLFYAKEVWSAIVEVVPAREVLRLLPKLHSKGLLIPQSAVHDEVIESLALEDVRRCRLSPIEVFIHKMNFKRGGKPLHPSLITHLKTSRRRSIQEKGGQIENVIKSKQIPNCPKINEALNRCMNSTYPIFDNLELNQRILVTLDATDVPNAACFKNQNISCLEAQAALALYYCKTEKQITFTIFSNREVKGYNLSKNSNFEGILCKLKENKKKYLKFDSVFDWAIERKKKVDLFICFIQHYQSLIRNPEGRHANNWSIGQRRFETYRKLLSSNAKLVVICPGSHDLQPFDAENSLTILGFCPEIPKVIKRFSDGTFQTMILDQ